MRAKISWLKNKKIGAALRIIKERPYIGFLLPSFAGVSIFILLPYIDVIRRAFLTSAGNEFAGLENFKDIFANDAFCLAVKNTIIFNIVCIPILLSLSLLIALSIYSVSMGGILKGCFMLPMAVPVAAVVVIWKALFSNGGLINGMLTEMGMIAVDWMNTPKAFAVLVLSYIWKNLGYNIILWIAGLSMIPQNMYDAAAMDGAGKWKTFTGITLPRLLPMMFIIVALALINAFKVFREVYLVSGNYPHESIYMIQHLFNNWFRDLSYDKMAAGACCISIIFIILVVLLQKAWENRDEE